MNSGAAGSGETDEPLIARLHTALRSAGADLSARELSDALWLALHAPPNQAGAVVPESVAVPPPGPGDTQLPPPEHPLGDTAEPAPREARRQVYALTHARDGGAPGAPVRIPGVRGLRHPLGIVRGLRALKRSVPSAHEYELDERATAEAIADSGVLDAVLRPAGDRWLHLVLAVDHGPSMRVWRDTVGELADALTGSGIFRSVRVSPLIASAPLPGDRTVVLAVTDGVADHWYTGAAHERLAALARTAPTAVLHLFPTRLWSGTGLAAEPMTVRTTAPAPPNSLLTALDPWLPAALRPRPALPVPVLELDELSLRPWADLIASRGGVAALRVIDAECPPVAAPFDGDTAGEPETAAERVQAFRATASPPAYGPESLAGLRQALHELGDDVPPGTATRTGRLVAGRQITAMPVDRLAGRGRAGRGDAGTAAGPGNGGAHTSLPIVAETVTGIRLPRGGRGSRSEPKQDRCHHRHPLNCGFSRAKHSGCHRYGALRVTIRPRCDQRGERAVAGRGRPPLPRRS